MNNNKTVREWMNWILYNVDDRLVFDLTKHKESIALLDEISRKQLELAIKEMIFNNTLIECKKDKTYILTSFAEYMRDSSENFNSIIHSVNSNVNLNEQVSKSVSLSKRATILSVSISIVTLIILASQTIYQIYGTQSVRLEQLEQTQKPLIEELKNLRQETILLPASGDSLYMVCRKKSTK